MCVVCHTEQIVSKFPRVKGSAALNFTIVLFLGFMSWIKTVNSRNILCVGSLQFHTENCMYSTSGPHLYIRSFTCLL